ncbi:MAG TPA: CoA pyrophosphatase [Anaerolineaceae bacterium]|nr:CoA pyrophosphatase [Anaerolineaceae bacterium]
MSRDCKSLRIDKIQSILQFERTNSITTQFFDKEKLKKAGILIPFVCVDGCWSLLFTRRADNLKSHQGQVSFPGGGKEQQDETLIDTALREAHEEIGLTKTSIHVLGLMPDFVTNSDFLVTPVVAWIDWPVPLEISMDEVSRVFTIPIQYLKNEKNWEERIYSHPSGWYGSVIFYNLYDGELLWGISAKITVDLLRMCKKIID